MNIFLLVSDTFRYDNLFDRAKMPVNTPELERFSERAASMENCWVSSFATIPHRTDLTTGRYGWPWYGWQSRLESSPNHAPLILKKADYVSQLLCDCPHLFRSDFDRGFDGAYAVRGQEADLHFTRMNHPIETVMPPEKTRSSTGFRNRNLPDLATWTNRNWRGEEDRFMAQTARLAVEWLEENYTHDPLFLWVDFFDPHEPWNPPEYMVRKYDPDYNGAPMVHPNYGRASDLTAEELRNLRAHYCAEAELVDRWAGRVLQKIDDLDLWKNSIVIFTADHGMSLGEHNRTGKSNINPGDDRFWPLYPEIAHIPMMIAAPDLEGGVSVDQFVQPPDILPSAMDLAGLDIEPPEPFHGRSFAPLLRGKQADPLRDFVVSSTFLRKENGRPPREACTPIVYTQEWAYAPIGAEGEKELFLLKEDPYAENNVYTRHREQAEEMHGMLIEWMKGVEAPAEAVEVFESI